MGADHTLSPEAHEAIRQRIARQHLADSAPGEKPRAIILAGQPGAGKSGLKHAALAELSQDGGAVVVDTDELRAEHPAYLALTAADDRTAAGLVQKDAGQWADELTHDSMAQRRNLVIDGTLKNPGNARRLCADLRAQGYDVEVRAIAVSREDSILGVYSRYETQKARSGSGRWVPESVHDEAYAGLPRSIDALEREGAVARMTVYRRGEDGPVEVHAGAGAARAFADERARPRTAVELAAREQRWSETMTSIRARDPALAAPENRRAAELAADALAKAAAGKEAGGSASPWKRHSGPVAPSRDGPER